VERKEEIIEQPNNSAAKRKLQEVIKETDNEVSNNEECDEDSEN